MRSAIKEVNGVNLCGHCATQLEIKEMIDKENAAWEWNLPDEGEAQENAK